MAKQGKRIDLLQSITSNFGLSGLKKKLKDDENCPLKTLSQLIDPSIAVPKTNVSLRSLRCKPSVRNQQISKQTTNSSRDAQKVVVAATIETPPPSTHNERSKISSSEFNRTNGPLRSIENENTNTNNDHEFAVPLTRAPRAGKNTSRELISEIEKSVITSWAHIDEKEFQKWALVIISFCLNEVSKSDSNYIMDENEEKLGDAIESLINKAYYIPSITTEGSVHLGREECDFDNFSSVSAHPPYMPGGFMDQGLYSADQNSVIGSNYGGGLRGFFNSRMAPTSASIVGYNNSMYGFGGPFMMRHPNQSMMGFGGNAMSVTSMPAMNSSFYSRMNQTGRMNGQVNPYMKNIINPSYGGIPHRNAGQSMMNPYVALDRLVDNEDMRDNDLESNCQMPLNRGSNLMHSTRNASIIPEQHRNNRKLNSSTFPRDQPSNLHFTTFSQQAHDNFSSDQQRNRWRPQDSVINHYRGADVERSRNPFQQMDHNGIRKSPRIISNSESKNDSVVNPIKKIRNEPTKKTEVKRTMLATPARGNIMNTSSAVSVTKFGRTVRAPQHFWVTKEKSKESQKRAEPGPKQNLA